MKKRALLEKKLFEKDGQYYDEDFEISDTGNQNQNQESLFNKISDKVNEIETVKRQKRELIDAINLKENHVRIATEQLYGYQTFQMETQKKIEIMKQKIRTQKLNSKTLVKELRSDYVKQDKNHAAIINQNTEKKYLNWQLSKYSSIVSAGSNSPQKNPQEEKLSLPSLHISPKHVPETERNTPHQPRRNLFSTMEKTTTDKIGSVRHRSDLQNYASIKTVLQKGMKESLNDIQSQRLKNITRSIDRDDKGNRGNNFSSLDAYNSQQDSFKRERDQSQGQVTKLMKKIDLVKRQHETKKKQLNRNLKINQRIASEASEKIKVIDSIDKLQTEFYQNRKL